VVIAFSLIITCLVSFPSRVTIARAHHKDLKAKGFRDTGVTDVTDTEDHRMFK